MESRSEIREFLTSRRARVSPADAGLADFGGRRRVAGLRRGEVAQLAGISIEYYTRLERGDARGASASVLDAMLVPYSSTTPNAPTSTTSSPTTNPPPPPCGATR
jgi:hypothetical protein